VPPLNVLLAEAAKADAVLDAEAQHRNAAARQC
jgi:hypothetical protein